MAAFDVPGALRRIRREADLSQRELARELDVSKSYVGGAESGSSGLDVRVLAQAAALAGLRLALLDNSGEEISAMAADAVRDQTNRHFPAHLDPRYSDEGWWHDAHRYSRERPWYTFDRDRRTRDRYRRRDGIPDDHQVPKPGDSPAERAAARREKHRRARDEERERAFLAGEFAHVGLDFECTCPPTCDEVDDRSGRPMHAPGCACDCDVA